MADCWKRKMRRRSESLRLLLTKCPGTADLSNTQPHTHVSIESENQLHFKCHLTALKCASTLLKLLNLFIQRSQSCDSSPSGLNLITHTDQTAKIKLMTKIESLSRR